MPAVVTPIRQSTTACVPQRQATERRCTHGRDHRNLCNAWGSYAQSVDGCVRKLQLCNSPGHGARMRPLLMAGKHSSSSSTAPRQGGPELADLLYGTGGPPGAS